MNCPAEDHRRVLDGMLWNLHSDVSWADMSARQALRHDLEPVLRLAPVGVLTRMLNQL